MLLKKRQNKINSAFKKIFGNTPLRQRLEDILNQATELSYSTDIANLREETGDLFNSLIQLMNECDWDANELSDESLKKIEKRSSQYQSLGRKTKVALLGGAFNPITVGHIQVAKFVLDSSRTFDEVWLMPCYRHMYNKTLAPSVHRLKMCRLAAEEDLRIKVSDFEIKNKLSGETYQLVKKLLSAKRYKDSYDFSIILGLDNANTFERWVNYQDLKKMMHFVVVPRTGIKQNLKSLWYMKPPHIFLVPSEPLVQTSSTQVRKCLKHYWSKWGDYITDPEKQLYLPSKVFDYIKERRLYDRYRRPHKKV